MLMQQSRFGISEVVVSLSFLMLLARVVPRHVRGIEAGVMRDCIRSYVRCSCAVLSPVSNVKRFANNVAVRVTYVSL